MKQLNQYILEKFKINKDNVNKIIVVKSKSELLKIIGERIENKKSSDDILDLNDLDVSNITDMQNLFSNLDDISNIDISDWDVSNVESMKSMFNKCRYLKTTGDLGNWDISSLKDTSFMFNGCNILRSIGDISSWDISKIETMKCMFQGCNKIKTIGDITNWKLPNSNYDVFDISPIKPQPPKRI